MFKYKLMECWKHLFRPIKNYSIQKHKPDMYKDNSIDEVQGVQYIGQGWGLDLGNRKQNFNTKEIIAQNTLHFKQHLILCKWTDNN